MKPDKLSVVRFLSITYNVIYFVRYGVNHYLLKTVRDVEQFVGFGVFAQPSMLRETFNTANYTV